MFLLPHLLNNGCMSEDFPVKLPNLLFLPPPPLCCFHFLHAKKWRKGILYKVLILCLGNLRILAVRNDYWTTANLWFSCYPFYLHLLNFTFFSFPPFDALSSSHFRLILDRLQFSFGREAPVDSWTSGRRVLLIFHFLTSIIFLRLEEKELWANCPSKQKKRKSMSEFFLPCWCFRDNRRCKTKSISSCFWVTN